MESLRSLSSLESRGRLVGTDRASLNPTESARVAGSALESLDRLIEAERSKPSTRREEATDGGATDLPRANGEFEHDARPATDTPSQRSTESANANASASAAADATAGVNADTAGGAQARPSAFDAAVASVESPVEQGLSGRLGTTAQPALAASAAPGLLPQARRPLQNATAGAVDLGSKVSTGDLEVAIQPDPIVAATKSSAAGSEASAPASGFDPLAKLNASATTEFKPELSLTQAANATPGSAATPDVALGELAGQVEIQGLRAQPAAMPTASAESQSVAVDRQTAASVLGQVRVAFRPGMQRAEVQLAPAELGRVSIRLEVNAKRVAAVAKVESQEALVALERHVPELKAAFAERGLEVSELSFELNSDARDSQPEQRECESGRKSTATVVRGATESTSTRSNTQLRVTDSAVDFYA